MDSNLSYIAERLTELTAIPSPTGYTKHATDYLVTTLTDLGLAPTISNKGNVLVELGGTGRPLVLASHVDTLGAMVRSIKDNGRLRPTTLGGHQWRTADGENCTVHTRDGRTYTGVVLNTEPSVHVADEKVEQLEKNMEVLLDENVSTKDETLALGVQAGDIIAMDPRTTITASGYIKSRFLDDKLSASILLGLARAVVAGEVTLARKVSLLFTVYEEVGHGGSVVPADTQDMISVDMGCVGADLANLANEAALRAVRKGRKLVTQEDMLAAFEFVIAGSEKKGSVLTEFEKKLVAYHEVGHAMVAYKQKNAEPVQKITIVPHTEGSLGYTLLMPEEDKTNLRTRDELMAKIAVSMGGRAAEEVVMNTMTNGASQDIQEATSIARNMVAMYGMSDAVGMVALGSVRNQYLDGGYGLDCAQDTAAIMDREVKRILDECYKDAVQVIRDNREDMDKVVAYLLEKETITGGEMVAILEGRDPSAVEEAYASTRKSEDGFRPSQPSVIEAPAKHISMTSEKIEMPPEDKGEDAQTEDKPSTEPETPDTSAENTDENK